MDGRAGELSLITEWDPRRYHGGPQTQREIGRKRKLDAEQLEHAHEMQVSSAERLAIFANSVNLFLQGAHHANP